MAKPVLKITKQCIKCDLCRSICPENAVLLVNNQFSIEPWSCTLCGLCREACPVGAIKLEPFDPVKLD